MTFEPETWDVEPCFIQSDYELPIPAVAMWFTDSEGDPVEIVINTVGASEFMRAIAVAILQAGAMISDPRLN